MQDWKKDIEKTAIGFKSRSNKERRYDSQIVYALEMIRLSKVSISLLARMSVVS